MAKKDKPNNWRKISASINNIQNQLDGIHKDTFFSYNNKTSLDNIADDILGSIDNIIANNSDVQGIPGLSRLYSRAATKNNEIGKIDSDVFEIFNDKKLVGDAMDVYSKTRSIKAMDEQIDMVCKYMPKLEQAITIKKDNVLSADSFTKDFINMISSVNKTDETFSSRVDEIKTKYNIQNTFDILDYRASKYGEAFLYCVPYKKAIQELLKRKNGKINLQKPILTYNSISEVAINESVLSSIKDDLYDGKILTVPIIENGSVMSGNGIEIVNSFAKNHDIKGSLNLNISVGIIESVIEHHKTAATITTPKSLYEQFLLEQSSINETTQKMEKTVPDELEYDKDDISSDGFVDKSKVNEKKEDIDIKVPGCVTKLLDRSNVHPLYMEDLCMGYLYIEYINPEQIDANMMKTGTISNMNMELDTSKEEDDRLLKYISGTICKVIDAAFVNSNSDLAKEIYMMLKYDDKFASGNFTGDLNVSFIPAEDIHHHYYNMDPKTHRGISDLYKGLIPATVWCMITQATAVGILTRGQDKRVYYVQQTGVDTNVAQNLMNVVNQIKRGNLGVRQLESINNITGIIGRYNDHIIPVGPSGEPPVRFEIMQGQNIETPTELLMSLEEQAIDPTDVPLELINATKSLDYAIHYSMSNSKFVSIVLKRQEIDQKMQSKVCTKIYNCEYNESAIIKVMLPPPKILALTNMTQLIASTKEYVTNLAETFCTELTDDEKLEWINITMRQQLAAYVNIANIESNKKMAKINVASRTIESDNEEQ